MNTNSMPRDPPTALLDERFNPPQPVEPPHAGLVLGWIRDLDASPTPAFFWRRDRGLAIAWVASFPQAKGRRVPKVEWRLSITHLDSGGAIVGTRAGWKIEGTRAEERVLERVLGALLETDVDWTRPVSEILARAREVSAPIIERLLPALPGWRALRWEGEVDSDGLPSLESRWFPGEPRARSWAERGDPKWCSVEKWARRPSHDAEPSARSYREGVAAVSRELGGECSYYEWTFCGRTTSVDAQGAVSTSREPEPPGDLAPVVWAWAFDEAKDLRAQQAPSGEYPPPIEAALRLDLLRLVDVGSSRPFEIVVPTRRGLLALFRAARSRQFNGAWSPHLRTDDSFEAWRASVAAARRRPLAPLFGGLEQRHEEFRAFARLLWCLGRDAAEPGRLELPRRFGHRDAFEVLFRERGVVALRCLPARGWERLSFVEEPVVPWAPRSARRPRPDSIEAHGADDWCVNAARERAERGEGSTP